jgi:hypothetical protein
MNKNFKPQACMTLSNLGGISIEINNTGEAVRYQWYDKKPSRWCEIKYNIKGEPFFRIRNTRYYLNKFMRFH